VKVFPREVAERGKLEVAGMSFRDQAGDQDLISGVTVGRHVVRFSFLCAVTSEQSRPARLLICAKVLWLRCLANLHCKRGYLCLCHWADAAPLGIEGGQRALRHQLRNRNL
jgi:hypothetical protein